MSKGGGVNIPSNYTITLGSSGGSPLAVDADIDPITVTSNSNVAVTQPIVTESTSTSTATTNSTVDLDLKVEPLDVKIEPLSVDSTSTIDLKPVVLDSCTTIRLAPLPPIRVEQPYTQHFGFTYMGMELFGFTMSGKSEVLISSPKKCHSGEPPFREMKHAEREEPTPAGPAPARPGSGLRVRVDDND